MINNKLLLHVGKEYEIAKPEFIGHSKFGTSNISYLINNKNTYYFLKRYSSSKLITVNKIIEVYKILDKEKIDSRILTPTANKRGSFLTEFEESYYFLFSFIDGKSKYKLNSQNIRDICNVLENFHSIIRFINPNHFSNKLFKPIDLDVNLMNALNIDFSYELSKLENLSETVIIKESLLHGDTDFTNFLFTDKLTALLDIDECNLGDAREEVIKTILGFSINRNNIFFNKAFATEFLKNFKELNFTQDVIDYYVYKHIFYSLNHFLLKDIKLENKINKIIINYFIEYLNTFRLNKENIHKVFNAS